MLLSKLKSRILVVLASTFIGAAANAGGPMVGGASEWTQIMNNVELVSQSMDGAQTATATMQTYLTQLKQLEYVIRNTARIDRADSATDYIRIADEIRRASAAAAAYGKVKGSLEQQLNAMQLRITEARVRGQSWEQYQDSVAKDVQQGNAYEAARLQREQDILQQTKADAQEAQRMSAQLEGQIGQMQSLQMTNRQLNQVIVQNGKMTEVLVGLRQNAGESSLEAKRREADSARQKELARLRYEAIRERQKKAVGIQ